MKNIIASLLVLFFAVGMNANAAEKHSGGRFVIGSTADIAVSGATAGGSIPALTGVLFFGDKSMLQISAGIFGITPNFNIGGGAAFKYTLVGDVVKGLHIGGGVHVGSNTGSFFIDINQIIGVHFELVDKIWVSADSGFLINIRTSPAAAVNLFLGGNNLFLGLTLGMVI